MNEVKDLTKEKQDEISEGKTDLFGVRTLNNVEFGDVRFVIMNGDPWFFGKDVASALGYANTREAVSDHVDD